MEEVEVTRRPSAASSPAPHLCDLCGRKYERGDHLIRHRRSHENARPHQCNFCTKGFNRADLLHRHELTHEKHVRTRPPSAKRSDRVGRACLACAGAKAKCEETKPCRRCRKKGIVCKTALSIYTSPVSEGEVAPTSSSDRTLVSRNATTDHGNQCSPNQEPETDQTAILRQVLSSSSARTFAHFYDDVLPTPRPVLDVDASIDQDLQARDLQVHSVIGQQNKVFTSNSNGADGFDFNLDAIYPANELDFNQDIDFNLWDFEIDDTQFDQFTSMLLSRQDGEAQPPSPSSARDVSKAYAAFKRSSWLWTPAQKDHALNDQDALNVLSDDTAHQLIPSSVAEPAPDSTLGNISIDSFTRDGIFALTVFVRNRNTRSPSFPTLELLNHIIRIFFVHQSYQYDNWIHPSSILPQSARPEFLLSVLSAGSMFISIPAVWKMGLAFQEIARCALARLFEEDNRTLRDLDVIQAFMLGLDVALWSGLKRRQEIAESFTQPLITMLRRGGLFASSSDSSSLIPSVSDTEELQEAKWKKWIHRESFKRLVLHMYIHDTQSSVALSKPPLMSLVEMKFPLPSSRDLWTAGSAKEWSEKYLSRSHDVVIPYLLDIAQDPDSLEALQDVVDGPLCSAVLGYSFWDQIWANQQFSKLHPEHKPTQQLWLTTQRQELYRDISDFRLRAKALNMPFQEMTLVAELLSMLLFVSADDMQRFAGKYGEEEARKALLMFNKWHSTESARKAAWHAGQVLRAAMSVPLTQLRDFAAIAVYFASICLWIYGLTIQPSGEEDFSRASVKRPTFDVQNSSTTVPLNGTESRELRTFLSNGQGLPGLMWNPSGVSDSREKFVPLKEGNIALRIARAGFRDNFQHRTESMPQLVQNLSKLLGELGDSPSAWMSRSASEAP